MADVSHLLLAEGELNLLEYRALLPGGKEPGTPPDALPQVGWAARGLKGRLAVRGVKREVEQDCAAGRWTGGETARGSASRIHMCTPADLRSSLVHPHCIVNSPTRVHPRSFLTPQDLASNATALAKELRSGSGSIRLEASLVVYTAAPA